MAYCIQDAGLTEQNRASALPNSVSYGLVKLFNTLNNCFEKAITSVIMMEMPFLEMEND